MTNAETLLSEDIALDVFKKLIFHHLRISKPIIQLKNIPHWIGFLGQIGLSDSPLDQLKTFLIGGYFYNFSSRVPPLSSLNELDKFSNVDLLMVPTVRDTSNTDLLKENGFL
jgi:hypothetical protein